MTLIVDKFSVANTDFPQGWAITAPWMVTDRLTDGVHQITDEFSPAYGVGNSKAEALGDYAEAFVAALEVMEENSKKMSPTEKLKLSRMQRHIHRTKQPRGTRPGR